LSVFLACVREVAHHDTFFSAVGNHEKTLGRMSCSEAVGEVIRRVPQAFGVSSFVVWRSRAIMPRSRPDKHFVLRLGKDTADRGSARETQLF